MVLCSKQPLVMENGRFMDDTLNPDSITQPFNHFILKSSFQLCKN